MNVTGDNGSPLNPSGFNGGSTTVNISAGSANTGDLSQGYAITTPPSGVTGYAVLRQTVPGVPDPEAVVPCPPALGRERSHLTKGISQRAAAPVNAGASSATVTVTAKSAAGISLSSGTITMAAEK